MQSSPVAEDLIDTEEAARFLRLRPATLFNWRYEKRGPAFFKIGRRVYYCVEDLTAWREKQRREPAAVRAA